jgi:hypothetical protein
VTSCYWMWWRVIQFIFHVAPRNHQQSEVHAGRIHAGHELILSAEERETRSLTLKGDNIAFFMHYDSETLFIIDEYVIGTEAVDPDSAVCIATCYGLHGPRIESRWRRDFPHLSRPDLGSTQTPVQWLPGLSGCKAAGAWRRPPTPSRAEVKEKVELYIYSPSGHSWPVLGKYYLYC